MHEITINERLVHVKGDDVFTDSLIIAQHSGNEHESIRKHIREHEDKFLKLGTLAILNRESTGGRREQFYQLNEPQASFLVTLLRNTDIVVDFKLALVQEFYRMRRFILEKQTADWQQSRLIGKQTRQRETDVILTKLIPLAESQGSKNAGKLYMTYSKLVNLVIGSEAGQRDNLPAAYVDVVRFMENAIENVISHEIDNKTHYKEIYQICKAKCMILKELAFLPALDNLVGKSKGELIHGLPS